MRNIKFVALFLAVLMIAGAMIGCKKQEEEVGEQIFINIKIVGEEGEVILEEEQYPTNATNVYDAVKYACEALGVNYSSSSDGNDLNSFDGVIEFEDDEYMYYWNYTINNKESKAENAASQAIEDGDKIVYTYESYKLGSADTAE